MAAHHRPRLLRLRRRRHSLRMLGSEASSAAPDESSQPLPWQFVEERGAAARGGEDGDELPAGGGGRGTNVGCPERSRWHGRNVLLPAEPRSREEKNHPVLLLCMLANITSFLLPWEYHLG
ncbi:hypothetical protein GQ55_1G278400 [Panicum hallii var. hallii]|uniref:Uncharacterized protein n=2 Tax=Panicum hallii TaxID=206008 RepID=A0A2T7F882_9POAL|nr:hypothetical protein GQ55_1G278400 [Panicum hallii var. hallii]